MAQPQPDVKLLVEARLRKEEIAMEQFQETLIDTLVITTKVGVPLVLLFIVGFMIRFLLKDRERR